MKYILLTLLFISHAKAFTLNNNFGASFDNDRVKVRVAGDTTCARAGLTVYELDDLIEEAIEKFWNRIPTSSLRLIRGDFTEVINNINDGKLCGPTDDACISGSSGNVIPPVNDIVIACNTLPANFGQNNVLAVTIPNNFAGRRIKGAVILINEISNSFGALSREDKIGVIAHEIGHAIGLGHTEDKSALMYYRTVDLRRALGQDDIDGVSYLYPVKFDGCGAMGRIDDGQKIDPMIGQMIIGFLFMLMLGKLFNRSERRPTT